MIKTVDVIRKTVQLSLLRVGIAWMIALLTFNFNRVTIADLGATAIIITTLLSLHYFLSPFQVFWGRIADRFPLFGLRRTPFIVGGALVGSLLMLLIPDLAVALSAGSPLALGIALLVFTLFGLAMAANGTSTYALMTEVTAPAHRGIVVAVTQTFLIVSAIASAAIAKAVMPVYTPEQMQALYNLSPWIVLGTTLPGVLWLERRVRPGDVERLAVAGDTARQSPFRIAWRLLDHSPQVRGFFVFMLLALLGIFLQDAILEVFGAEVFQMTAAETTRFTQVWGGGVLLGMLLVGGLTLVRSIAKKLLATVGGVATGVGLLLLALAAVAQQAAASASRHSSCWVSVRAYSTSGQWQ